jgi:O-antigen/teichoic acid export membrane protein
MPLELKRRMVKFVLQCVVLMIVGVIVTDRSEVFFLRAFSDWKQLAFYSVAFGIADKLLTLPRILAAGAGLSLLLETSRRTETAKKVFIGSARYLALIVLPLHIGTAALAEPLIRVAYGSPYLPAVPAVIISLILMIPKAFQFLPETLFQATDRQAFLVKWGVISAGVNVALDLALIPFFGALGAAIGNGIAQIFAVTGVWMRATKENEVKIPVSAFLSVAACAGGMGIVVLAVSLLRIPTIALAMGLVAGLVSYVLLLRFGKCVSRPDVIHFKNLTHRLPRVVQMPADRALSWLESA